MRIFTIIALVGAAAIPRIAAQSSVQAPAIEVASVKRNISGVLSTSADIQPGGRVSISNTTVRSLIENLYSVPSHLVVGGPEWLQSERYDLQVVAPTATSRTQVMLAMQALLADRFKLVLRREPRDMPVYALVRARADSPLGPQLRRTVVECQAPDGAPKPGAARCGFDVSGASFTGTGTTLAILARSLTPAVGRVVIDKTGLEGRYDLTLRWAPAASPSADASSALGDNPSLFTAVQEQLGLRLDAQRAPVDVLVIESVERPAEN